MTDSVVPGKCVSTTELLRICANWTTDLPFLGVVDSILMPCQVVRPRELCVAWLARAGVDLGALVRSVLSLDTYRPGYLRSISTASPQPMCLPVALPLVLLE